MFKKLLSRYMIIRRCRFCLQKLPLDSSINKKLKSQIPYIPKTAASCAFRLLLTRQIYKCSTQWQQCNSILPLAKHCRLVSKVLGMQILSSLYLRSGYPQIGLTPEANRKWHWNVAPFQICSLPGVFCYLMSQVL